MYDNIAIWYKNTNKWYVYAINFLLSNNSGSRGTGQWAVARKSKTKGREILIYDDFFDPCIKLMGLSFFYGN